MVDIIPKQQSETSIIGKAIMLVSLLFFTASLIAYGTFAYQKSKLQKQLDHINEQLTAGVTDQQRETEQMVIAESRRINDFAQLVESQKDFDKYFRFYEESVHPDAVFQGTSLPPDGAKVAVSGTAISLSAVQEQVLIFRSRPEVSEATLTSVNPGETDEASFTISVTLTDEFLSS